MRVPALYISVVIIGIGSTQSAHIAEQIYNGYNAVRGQFPYQTLQVQNAQAGGYSFCGGSLISTRWVMTAAHCAYQMNYTTVYIGMTNTNDNTGVSTFTVPKSNHYVHPQYNPNTLQNDIALLKLPSAVTTSQYVSTINLPKLAQANSSTFDSKMATASGWGQTQNDETGIHHTLQYRTVNVMPHKSCVNYYRNVNTVTDEMICTDKQVVYAGPCHGDSGGPLAVNGTDGKPMVIGTVSWGIGSCSDSYPVVFVNIPYYLKWINNVTGIAIN